LLRKLAGCWTKSLDPPTDFGFVPARIVIILETVCNQPGGPQRSPPWTIKLLLKLVFIKPWASERVAGDLSPGFWNLVFYYFNSLVEKYFSLSFELVKWNFSTVDPRTAKENDTNNILQTFQQLLLPPSVNLQLHLLALSRKKSFPLSRREHFHFVVFLLFAQRLLAFLCQRHMVSTDDCHFLAARNTARRRFTLSKTFPYAAYSVICHCSDAPDCLHSSSHLRYRAIIFADQVKTWAGKQERLTVRKATRAFPRFLQSSLKLDAVHDMSELR